MCCSTPSHPSRQPSCVLLRSGAGAGSWLPPPTGPENQLANPHFLTAVALRLGLPQPPGSSGRCSHRRPGGQPCGVDLCADPAHPLVCPVGIHMRRVHASATTPSGTGLRPGSKHGTQPALPLSSGFLLGTTRDATERELRQHAWTWPLRIRSAACSTLTCPSPVLRAARGLPRAATEPPATVLRPRPWRSANTGGTQEEVWYPSSSRHMDV